MGRDPEPPSTAPAPQPCVQGRVQSCSGRMSSSCHHCQANHCTAEHQTRLGTQGVSSLHLHLGKALFSTAQLREEENLSLLSPPIQQQIMEEAELSRSPPCVAIRNDGGLPLGVPGESWSHWGVHRGLSPSQTPSFAVQNGFGKSSVAAGAVAIQECWFPLYSVTMNE